MDTEMMAAMGITGFGKVSKKKQLDPNRFEKTKRDEEYASAAPVAGPSREPTSATPNGHTNGESDESKQMPPPAIPSNNYHPEYEYEADEDTGSQPFPAFSSADYPISHEISLKDHTKVVSALALDPSGARIVSGSHDYDTKLWDFGGMDARTRPFKSWEPQETHYVHDVQWSKDGKRFLVVSGTTQVKMYDREGEELGIFVKGDPYIRDMKNTSQVFHIFASDLTLTNNRGHVGELSSCAWHPTEPEQFITASTDSTIRIWTASDKRKQKAVIVFKSKDRGARTRVTACAYSPDGGLIGGACVDGAIQMWSTGSNYVRPSMTVELAHTKGTEPGSLLFSSDGKTVVTRGGDDFVKVWDLRSFKKPVAERGGFGTLYPGTNAVFSPDEKTVVTGSAAEVKGGHGRLVFMDSSTLAVNEQIEIKSTPVKLVWHPKINQILAGLANGEINVLYSPKDSINGAKLVLSKGPARARTIEDVSAALTAPTILTPHALPMFRDPEAGGAKRKRDKDRKDPRKSHRPELPISGPGKGGRVGASATQHVVQNLVRDTTRDEDPRAALLKYATADNETGEWTKAWAGNARVFAKTAEEGEGDSDEARG